MGNRFVQPGDAGNLYGQFVVNPQPLWQPDYVAGDFAPRIGFAVGLGRNTVVRGGFATFTNIIPAPCAR